MKRSFRTALVGMLIVASVLALVASAEDETPQAADGASDSGGDTETFAVGDPIDLGDYRFVVHSFQPQLPPTQFSQPAAGNRYVGVNVEVTNNTDEPNVVSSILSFELQDGQNNSYSVGLTDHQPASPDGEIPPGGAKRGLLVYEVPQNARNFRLNFVGDLFASGTAVVDL